MINIQDIIPIMKKGWVAMDENRIWVWYSHKPVISKQRKLFLISRGTMTPLDCFYIAPVADWTKSLICIKGKGNE
jgi:hypothetical protein